MTNDTNIDQSWIAYRFRELIDACRNGVLVPAPDIGDDQRREIGREVDCMSHHLKHFEKTLELQPLCPSIHLTRNEPSPRIGSLDFADEIVKRATKAYQRRCTGNGEVFQQPSNASTFNPTSLLVELVNVRGTIATYRYDPNTDRLRYIVRGGA